MNKAERESNEMEREGNEAERGRALRIVDANANRAAEGLRTIEEVARLVCEDRAAAEWMKTLRHQLSKACEHLPRGERLAARSVESDAGTNLSNPSETSRTDIDAIVSAAAERTTQSLRALEEFTKVLGDSASQAFKQLRYAAYDALAQTELRLTTKRARFKARLYVLVDCSLALEVFSSYLRELADAGVDGFQLRDKRAEGAELMQYARAAVDCLKNSAGQFFVNDRADIALASGAAGVHLGQEDMQLADAQKISNGKLIIGVSTHDIEQAIAAEAAGADYIGCGPTFPSQTKTFTEFPGLDFLTDVGERISIPYVAIGGINPSNLQQVAATGCRRIAVTNAIHAAASPTQAARELRKSLD